MAVNGECTCSKCGKKWCGARQSKEKKLAWRSPCCKAIGMNWNKSIMVADLD